MLEASASPFSQPSCVQTASLSAWVTQALLWVLEVTVHSAGRACSAVEHLKVRKVVSCHPHSWLLVLSERHPQNDSNSLFYTVDLWLVGTISSQLILCSSLDFVLVPHMTWISRWQRLTFSLLQTEFFFFFFKLPLKKYPVKIWRQHSSTALMCGSLLPLAVEHCVSPMQPKPALVLWPQHQSFGRPMALSIAPWSHLTGLLTYFELTAKWNPHLIFCIYFY